MAMVSNQLTAIGRSSKTNHHAYTYARQSCSKQFWKAGEYEGNTHNTCMTKDVSSISGFDHARMHPRFLHSNATSHKWALGAFAELLDNALDETNNGATYVSIDVIENKKDGSKMLLVEDDGGGMDHDKMRKCMSLGYSEKSKNKETIGQYGNGFKTSTMRLGADVLVFSRTSTTQSIGLLSYTFLRSTGKEDIVVPMLDYERRRGSANWTETYRTSHDNWKKSLNTILEWSPFKSEEELKNQFGMMKDQGTRIIIYNLWEDDEGNLELDLDSEPHDIQMRGVNRDETNIQRADQYPNSRYFLTYRHSLRSYAAILYLRLPSSFKIILRGKDVEHHNVLDDLMWPEDITYRPKQVTTNVKETSPPKKRTKKGNKDTQSMVTKVTLGFVKDAENHLDVQGFNVYHRNRLITPFWRVWNAAGSDGRGVIGVMEADYINPAHDKQGFEHTVLLDRLKQKLAEEQKNYWSTNCHKIGYAPRRNKRAINEERKAANKPSSPGLLPILDSNLVESSSYKSYVLDSNLDKSPSQKSPVLDSNLVEPCSYKSPVLDSNLDNSSSEKSPVLDSNLDNSSSQKRPLLDTNLDKSCSRKRPLLDSNLDKSSSRKRPLGDVNTSVVPNKSLKISSEKSPNRNRNMHKKTTLQRAAEKSSTPSGKLVVRSSTSKLQHNMIAATSDKQVERRCTDNAMKNTVNNVVEVVHHSQREDHSQSEREAAPLGTSGVTTKTPMSKGHDVDFRRSPLKGDPRVVEQPIKEKQRKAVSSGQNERCKSSRNIDDRNQKKSDLKEKLLNASNTIADLRAQLQKANEEIKNQEERAHRHIEENISLKNQLEKANEEISVQNRMQMALIEMIPKEKMAEFLSEEKSG